jgi:hypothetical protein
MRGLESMQLSFFHPLSPTLSRWEREFVGQQCFVVKQKSKGIIGT